MRDKEANLNPLLGQDVEEGVDLVGPAAVPDEDDLVIEVAQHLVERFPLLVHSFGRKTSFTHLEKISAAMKDVSVVITLMFSCEYPQS